MSPRVDFYLSEEAGEGARLRLACRVTEKAYVARQRVLVYCDDATLLPKFDELLWTFGDGSFVPHDTVVAGKHCDAPVVLSHGPLPESVFLDAGGSVLINLSACVPPFFEKFARVAEFLDARPEVRAAGRDRFKVYRGKSIDPKTHTV